MTIGWFAVVLRQDHDGEDMPPLSFGPYDQDTAWNEANSDEGEVFYAMTTGAKEGDGYVADACIVAHLCKDCREPIEQREEKALSGDLATVWMDPYTGEWVCPKTGDEHEPVVLNTEDLPDPCHQI